MLRRIPFEKIENFRDLGGYYTDYGETNFGIVFRSGTLSDATDNDVEKISNIGIRYILDLRSSTTGEDSDKFQTDDRFIVKNVRVKHRKALPKTAFEMENDYLTMLEDFKSAKQIFLSLAYAPKPMLVHCMAGKDRTGVFLALLLLFNGVPYHDVNADYMISAPYLTRLKRVTLDKCSDFPNVIMSPDSFFLKGVLRRFFKKYKTIEQYFRVIGLKDKDIFILKNLLGVHTDSITVYANYKGKILLEKTLSGYQFPRLITNNTFLYDILNDISSEKKIDGNMLLPAIKTQVDNAEQGRIYKSEMLGFDVTNIYDESKYLMVDSYKLDEYIKELDYSLLSFADELINKTVKD